MVISPTLHACTHTSTYTHTHIYTQTNLFVHLALAIQLTGEGHDNQSGGLQ